MAHHIFFNAYYRQYLESKKGPEQLSPGLFLCFKLLCNRDLVEIKSSLVNIFKKILRIKVELDFFQILSSNPTTRNLCPIAIEFRHSNTSAII